jgi:hypothetical protein
MIVTNGKLFVVNLAPWRKPRTSASRLPIRNTHRPLMAVCRPMHSLLTNESVVVLFALMPNRCDRHSVIVFNFKKRHVSRVSEGDQEFSPAGVLLQ